MDAWLLLVEKMVNTKNILESPHTLPAKSTQPGFVSFDPLQYLIKTQKVCDHFFVQMVVQNRSVFVLINVKENDTEAQNVWGLFQASFHAVMSLWNKKPLKVYGGRMSESILAILCHIIKGEQLIKVSTSFIHVLGYSLFERGMKQKYLIIVTL